MKLPRDRALLARYTWAGLLGATILGLTVVLFDEDLGTGAPLFGEWTCLPRGKLTLHVTNGFDEPYIISPQMTLKINATGDGEARPIFLIVHWREADGPWSLFFSQEARTYPHYQVVGPTTERTEIYVVAKDSEGRYCPAESGVLRTKDAA